MLIVAKFFFFLSSQLKTDLWLYFDITIVFHWKVRYFIRNSDRGIWCKSIILRLTRFRGFEKYRVFLFFKILRRKHFPFRTNIYYSKRTCIMNMPLLFFTSSIYCYLDELESEVDTIVSSLLACQS